MWAHPSAQVSLPFSTCGLTLQHMWDHPSAHVGSPFSTCGLTLQHMWAHPSAHVGSPFSTCGLTLQHMWDHPSAQVSLPFSTCGLTLQHIWVHLSAHVDSPYVYEQQYMPYLVAIVDCSHVESATASLRQGLGNISPGAEPHKPNSRTWVIILLLIHHVWSLFNYKY